MKEDVIKLVQDNHELYVRNMRAAKYSQKVAQQRAERIQSMYNWISASAIFVSFIICSAVCGIY